MKTKTIFGLIITLFAFAMIAYGSEPSPWVFNSGDKWSPPEKSYLINPSTFTLTQAVYPSNGLFATWDAAYSSSTSTLYVSGGMLSPYWYSSAIAVYNGTPESLTFVSLSDVGMDGCYWLAGIEYIENKLYGICQTDVYPRDGRNFLIEISNPGTPSQTVNQIGPYMGAIGEMGYGYALCKDGHGRLYGSFANIQTGPGHQKLYSIDISTGNAVLLHSYPYDYFDGSLDGLTMIQDNLYGITHRGSLYQIDLDTYQTTLIGNLDYSIWTALVTVPEPSTILIAISGIALFLRRKSR
jgi:hypothetical protein